MVGNNVQVAVDAKHHLVVAYAVTNSGSDRAQLSPMAKAARDAMGKARLPYLFRRYEGRPRTVVWLPSYSFLSILNTIM